MPGGWPAGGLAVEQPLAAWLCQVTVQALLSPTLRRKFPSAEVRQFNKHWEILSCRDLVGKPRVVVPVQAIRLPA